MSDELPEFFVSSRNMWKDLGEPDAEMKFARCQLMSRVMDLVLERRLTQKCAAEILGTNQPTVSDLMRGKMHKFSLERLIAFLNALGQDVQIRVCPRPEVNTGPAVMVVGEGIPA